MSYTSAVVPVLAVLASSPAISDPRTLSGVAQGAIDRVETEAATTTVVKLWPDGADPSAGHGPFPFSGEWSFTWDDARPGEVDFAGSAVFGNYFTITDAGSMGGVTRQIFHDFAHHMEGTATWDAATRTLRYRVKPAERDAGGASTITQASEPACEKVSGMFAKTGCSAFLGTNTALEGLKLNFVFSDDLMSFEGSMVMTQYGGSGLTRSRTDMTASVSGTLK